jgi:hypothetical protein
MQEVNKMIGKPEWFTYRILGWGVRPKTKEGWIYVLIMILIVAGISFLPIPSNYKMIAIFAFIGLVLIDVLHIMTQMTKHHDERENMHQLIIERNCSFAAIVALASIAVYQSIKNAGQTMPFDVSIAIVLGVMLAVKIGSTIYVKVKM